MDRDEVTQLIECYNEDYKEDYEKLRLLACAIVQPHYNEVIEPKQLLKFIWDNESNTDYHILDDNFINDVAKKLSKMNGK